MKRRTFISHTAQAAVTVTFVAACKEASLDPYAGIERPSLIAYMDEVQLLQIGYLYGEEMNAKQKPESALTSTKRSTLPKNRLVYRITTKGRCTEVKLVLSRSV